MWLFSKALVADYANSLSSQEAGGVSWLPSFSDGKPSAPSSSNCIGAWFSPSGKTTESFPRSLSGVATCATLTAATGLAVLTWFLAASPVRTSAEPIRPPLELRVRVRVSGNSSYESFAKLDTECAEKTNLSSGWRTHQCSLLGGWEPFSETWPNWGIMRDGECWARTTLEDSTSASACSLWATPIERDWKDSPGMATETADRTRLDTLPRQVFAFWPTAQEHDRMPGHASRLARKGKKAGYSNLNDSVVAMWPTPTVHGNTNFKGAGPKSANGLGTEAMAAFGPTPNSSNVETAKSGPLNPEFVEWLMGFPCAWTALAPLETHKFRQWLPRHFNF